MSLMLRVLTKVAITSTQIVARAFVDAYRIAAKNSAQNTGKLHSDSSSPQTAADQKTGMALHEAIQILNIPKDNISTQSILEKYDHLFKSNDPANGGSIYLQSKVFRAKERLDLELSKNQSSSQE